jgi:hypothetical protein
MAPKIKSDFAILDVKAGRRVLAKHFAARPLTGDCPQELRIPVLIYGHIVGVWGRDDGISQEFHVDVSKISAA